MIRKMNEDFHVIVIGAGTTGLSIAQGLKQLGIKCTVFERQDKDNYTNWQREWSMGFHWGADYVKHWPQDIKDDLPMAQNAPNAEISEQDKHTIPVINGKTGELLVSLQTPTTRRVRRTKLRSLLSRGIDVHYGKKFNKSEDHGDRITAFFEDGSTVDGNLLVGCDSAQSKVRQCVLPPEKINLEYLPFTPLNFTYKFTAEQAKFIRSFHHPWVMISTHPESTTMVFITVADIGDPKRPETCVFQLLYSRWGGVTPETKEGRVALFKEIGQQFCEPFRSAAMWVEDDTYIHPDRLTHWPNPQQWDNHGGRVTLAGDAAHPMAPSRGQGLNNALEDAAHYVEAITSFLDGKQSLSDAINAYDAEVLARGKKEVDISFKQAIAFHHWDMIMESAMAKHGQYKLSDEEWKIEGSRPHAEVLVA